MDDVALVSTKRSMSHEKLSFIVRTMWATSVESAWFKLAAIDLVTVNGLWTKFSNGSTFVTVDREGPNPIFTLMLSTVHALHISVSGQSQPNVELCHWQSE